jgi:hypothetical protein
MMRQRQRNKTVTNKKRGSGLRSIGGSREAAQWWKKDNNDGGEGIRAKMMARTMMAKMMTARTARAITKTTVLYHKHT